MSLDALEVEQALAGLKDFQRKTVDHVFKRMWLDPSPATRFLVADEVGLGKTLVARGIIARTLAHLRADPDMRIDVVYVCSNAAIARQNLNRLNVLGEETFTMATRLTLLPQQLHTLEKNRVNFVSFTPGTTFNLRSSTGRWEERVLLHRLLARKFPELAGPLTHLLRCSVDLPRFRKRISEADEELNDRLAERFLESVHGDEALQGAIRDVAHRFRAPREDPPPDDKQARNALVGMLRNLLARECVDALEPDLVIMDEFQRFQDLLDGDDEAAELARAVTDYTTPEGHAVRVLLLSATPYKPLTLSGDDEDHHRDFLRTLRFLFDDPFRVAKLEEHLRIYRRGLFRSAEPELAAARTAIEESLRSVMVRTERVGQSRNRDSMVETRVLSTLPTPDDLHEARLLSAVADALDASDMVEYWKSAPYLLQFMRDYRLKEKLRDAAEEPSPALRSALEEYAGRFLTAQHVEGYGAVDAANGRLRALLEEMVEPGQWRLLWMHPSMPYMEAGGAYAEVRPFTKALVFSAWTVVPDVISAMCSYEVERRVVERAAHEAGYQGLYRSQRPLLRFTESEGRLRGMPALALMYPSVALSDGVDPLGIAVDRGGGVPVTAGEARRVASAHVEALLRASGEWPRPGGGSEDQRWYWAALAILDRPHLTGMRRWMTSKSGWQTGLGAKDDTSLTRHIDLFSKAAEGQLAEELGPAPDDLVEVLVDLALGSPAICALRALRRIAPGLVPKERDLLQGAVRVADGFRTLFNLPETILLLRGKEPDAYWRLALQHGVDGNLQAVLDEYVHQLRESLGLADHEPREVVEGVAGAMAEALSIRTSRIASDELRFEPSGAIGFERLNFRARFALRFGDLKDDQESTLARVGTVRSAFNSPFRPFILASTSVGQEGLDFHPYCHAVYHWNLPTNPVDLEQREGRVHRYKGHAVRRNVALRWGLPALREWVGGWSDPWEVLFQVAVDARDGATNDLVPYWIYEVEGGVRVERCVPLFPYSREVGALARLQKGLAVYRLAFGQPRQEDLMELLMESEGANRPRISLAPP